MASGGGCSGKTTPVNRCLGKETQTQCQRPGCPAGPKFAGLELAVSPESFCLLFQPPLSGPVSFIHSFIAKLLRAPELCAPVSPQSARRLTLGSYMANFNKLPLEAFTEKGASA